MDPGSDGERQPEIPGDLAPIERTAKSVDAKLIIIDPLMAFLASATNSFRDQDIRRALAPLATMSQRTRAAVLVVRHLNKNSEGNALYRGGGSIGIIGAARSGLLVPDSRFHKKQSWTNHHFLVLLDPAARHVHQGFLVR
ncbi:MAG: hypothetical protein DMG58_20015 [Acidobacteria bacterium]|nr:MAG: hypothetical protein DMG58_20015 [Acidobacteriota bacterium]